VADVQDAGREHFDVDHDFVAHLNGECLDWAGMDAAALQRTLQAQGDDWYDLVRERCPHLFAAVPVFISDLQWQQMREVIAAAEQALGAPDANKPHGVFYGYDFHLNAQGAHLIEINTNAGGGFLNALLIESQREAALYGDAVGEPHPEQAFLAMFRNEWRRARGDAPLTTVAIVDEQPQGQYLYPEFLLAQRLCEQAGIAAFIADPAELHVREDVLYIGERRIDLVYNRLTDFTLQRYPHLRDAWEMGQVVLTPDPQHHARHADKQRLVALTDADWLHAAGVPSHAIEALLRGIPQAQPVRAEDAERWWGERKAWFFKPASGYGSKGAYRGDKLTRRVFEEVMQSGDYIAQRLAAPGERKVCLGAEAMLLKYDVRCYVYDGTIQLVAARLYQGQTTNFRTPGGGFALVRVIS
jgi:glutathione synthase/RimK-type ligase-like ATP-grasp enzyme